ncbi:MULTISPECIES: hypothetical protein [unclassified Dyella]|uniref:hypothetical protein n=1 Tax=Dyella sp. ASV21 TaxID=2795114 RepID=UPI0018ED61F0|nr:MULTISPECIES: hypothetical protein [unclassified Dyella]
MGLVSMFCGLVLLIVIFQGSQRPKASDRQALLDGSSETNETNEWSSDGRVKGEPKLTELAAPSAEVIEFPIMTSKQLFDRLAANGGPNVIVSEERVQHIRSARNLLKPREDLVEPAVEVPYEVADLGLPPDLMVDEHVEVWAHEEFSEVA